MDLFFGRFADAHLVELQTDDLNAFEALLMEEDPKIMSWVTEQEETPAHHKAMVDRLRSFAINQQF